MENMRTLLLLVDGNALVHRAYHALPPLTAPKTGEIVGAVYGFASMLIRAINDLKPTHTAVAFDRKAPTFRHELFAEYKAHRPATPDELISQLGRVREVVRAFQIPIFEMDGYEADDILGSLSTQAAQQNIQTVILTGDADMMQLVSPLIKVYYPRPGGSFSDAMLYDEAAVRAKYGVEPVLIADLKALKGDPSDNIPGVSGVGEKTALKLVQQFGPVEQMLTRMDEIEPAKLKDKIKANVEVVKQSKVLTTIVRETPVILNFEECCRMSRYDRTLVTELFRDLGFNSLLAKLPSSEIEQPAPKLPEIDIKTVKIKYNTINTPAELEELIKRLAEAKSLAISIEGSGLNPMNAQMVGLALSPEDGEGYYIPFSQPGFFGGQQLSPTDTLARLKPVLENPAVEKNIHNSKYALVLLAENGIEIDNFEFDTMLAAYLLGDKSLGLKELVFARTGLEILPSKDLTGSGAKQISLFQVDSSEVAAFACANADMTGRLAKLLKTELAGQPELRDLYVKVESPLVPVLARMERWGIGLDTGLLNEMSERLAGQLKALEREIFNHAGHEFNINSPAQLGGVLFDEMHLPGKKVHGKYSTEASVLEQLSENSIIQDILEYRQLIKLKSTYIDALPGLVNPRTGRVHTSFNQTRTTTGRLSSSEPNLQNIPIKSELGRSIRLAFIAPPGSVLLAGDYSQIDLRALAHLSQDENLLEAFRQDKDIHAATAAQIFNVDISEVKPEMRRLAKTVNFGVIYGMSEFGLEQATELSRQEAGKFITAYFNRYPGVVRYLEATREQARRTGYVSTILGRRRYIQEINSANRMVRESAERMAINMPVQGTSSDIIKVAMVDLHKELQSLSLKSRMLLQVHDELIFEVPLDELDLMSKLVPQKMSAAIKLSVPVKVDIKSGPNWGSME